MRQYLELLQQIVSKGVDRTDRTGVGTRSLFGLTMRFNLNEGFPILTTKKVAFNQVKAELLWFLSGSSDVKELQARGCHIWDGNAESPEWKPKASFQGDVGRIYGAQWRDWRGRNNRSVDQIGQLIERIKREPSSRRHIVTAWNPAELDQACLPPCHILFQLYVAEGKISLALYQRSCDMFLGVPFNISSYSLLLSMIAHVTGLKPFEFVHFLGDAHIYHNHFAQVQEQLKREPLPLPRLWLNPRVSCLADFQMDDIKLIDYKHHPAIKAPLNV